MKVRQTRWQEAMGFEQLHNTGIDLAYEADPSRFEFGFAVTPGAFDGSHRGHVALWMAALRRAFFVCVVVVDDPALTRAKAEKQDGYVLLPAPDRVKRVEQTLVDLGIPRMRWQAVALCLADVHEMIITPPTDLVVTTPEYQLDYAWQLGARFGAGEQDPLTAHFHARTPGISSTLLAIEEGRGL